MGGAAQIRAAQIRAWGSKLVVDRDGTFNSCLATSKAAGRAEPVARICMPPLLLAEPLSTGAFGDPPYTCVAMTKEPRLPLAAGGGARTFLSDALLRVAAVVFPTMPLFISARDLSEDVTKMRYSNSENVVSAILKIRQTTVHQTRGKHGRWKRRQTKRAKREQLLPCENSTQTGVHINRYPSKASTTTEC